MLRRCQAVSGCLDSRERGCTEPALLAGRRASRLIDGGLAGHGRASAAACARTFLPPTAPATVARCPARLGGTLPHTAVLPAPPAPQALRRRPHHAVEASIVGAMQVQGASLKILHKRRLAGGEGHFYNGLTYELLPVRYERDEACPCHDAVPVSDLVMRFPEEIGQIGADMLLQRARNACGKDARVRLVHSVVESLSCRRCGRCQEVQWLEAKLDPLRQLCPDCGVLRHRGCVTYSIGKANSATIRWPIWASRPFPAVSSSATARKRTGNAREAKTPFGNQIKQGPDDGYSKAPRTRVEILAGFEEELQLV